MKTLSKLGILAALGASLFMSSCTGEYYVSDQPADVAYERGAPPYEGAVWIGDDWYGVVEDMYINTATGQDNELAALMYPETGTIMEAAVTHGIKDIGQDKPPTP
ncbi:hypothetical protein ACPPVU_16500 [Mucilaginibacter sp. McL0603]|uniref:hypothetical protein n=1 Tax=Mucilaginibacter sp. McL0603 TaxID=3415670 RepID=UPI003CF24D60